MTTAAQPILHTPNTLEEMGVLLERTLAAMTQARTLLAGSVSARGPMTELMALEQRIASIEFVMCRLDEHVREAAMLETVQQVRERVKAQLTAIPATAEPAAGRHRRHRPPGTAPRPLYPHAVPARD